MGPLESALSDLFERTRAAIVAVGSRLECSDFGAGLARLGTPPSGAIGMGRRPPPAPPVVDTWLDSAVAGLDPADPVGAAFAQVAERLPWRRSYEHLEAHPTLDGFRDHYSYAVLAGPLGIDVAPAIELPDVLVGFTLQGPNVEYPHHHHRPAELYGVLSGTLQWQVDAATAAVGPGDVIVHRSNESHSMTTLDRPALTWVFWPDAAGADVWMPSMQPDAPDPKRYSDRGRAAFAG